MSEINKKIIDFLNLINIEDKKIESINKYLNNKITKLKLSSETNINLLEFEGNEKRSLYSYLRELFSTNNKTLIKDHLIINLELFGFSLLPAVASFTGYYSNNSIYKFIEYDIPEKYIIKWCLDGVDITDFKTKHFFIDYFDALYIEDEDIFEGIYEYLDDYSNYFLTVYLILKNPNKYKMKRIWLEKEIRNKILDSFSECGFKNEGFERNFVQYVIKKFLDGNTIVNDNMLDDLFDNIDLQTINVEYLSFYIGLSYLIVDVSEIGRKLIKLTIRLDYNIGYTTLYSVLSFENETEEDSKNVLNLIGELNNKLILPKEEFVSWIGNRLARMDYYKPYSDYLKKETDENEAIIEKACEFSDELGTCYLKSFYIKDCINSLEDYYIEVFKKIFKSLEIPNMLIQDYLNFLSGKNSFIKIKGIINELNEIYLDSTNENLELLRGIYWIKNISYLYNRSTKFFMEINKFELVADLTRLNIYGVNENEINNFVIELENSNVSENKVLDFLILNANENYNKEWQNYFKKNILSKENILIEYLKYCDEYNKVYIIEEIFISNKSKYVELLINNIKNSTILVRQKIIDLLGDYRESYDLVKPLLFVKSEVIREIAVGIFSYWQDDEAIECLNHALEIEEDINIKRMIDNILNGTDEIVCY
jgi:hypothetical protein